MPIQDITTALMAENNVTQNDILYLETKSIFVQLIRSLPRLADRRPIQLPLVAETAATSKDGTLVRKGIKVKEMLRELEELKLVDRRDNYKLLTDEVAAELAHLGNLREKVVLETRSLESVYKTICDHNAYLRSQLEQYKAYLQNVRQTTAGKVGTGGVGVVTVAGKDNKPKQTQQLGPFKFTHQQFEKDGIIVETNVPENRCVARPTGVCVGPVLTSFGPPDDQASSSSSRHPLRVLSSLPCTSTSRLPFRCRFVADERGYAYSKGREKAILEMDLKIDDLLEKKNQGVEQLDMEYVSLNVSKVLALLNK
jgi:Ras GTPase-activating-like protein IQGAP2/3